MKLSDWNNVLKYADYICREAKEETGLDIRPEEYRMYDGRKGISIKVFDIRGKLYKEIFSGICDTLAEMERALRRCISEVKQL